MKLLKELYLTHSPTFKEKRMSKLLQKKLQEMKIPFKTDKHWQIWRDNSTPLLCAHMDQIQMTPIHDICRHKGKLIGLDKKFKQGGLGADDKNGIWICLKLIELFPDLSFIFTVEEENGGLLGKVAHNLNWDKIPYGLVFDRKGNSDIIGSYNQYCEEDFEDDVMRIAGKYNYNRARGVFSDCDRLSYDTACINISCGYYNAHSNHEYTILTDLLQALQLGKDLIANLPRDKKYKIPEATIFNYADEWSELDKKEGDYDNSTPRLPRKPASDYHQYEQWLYEHTQFSPTDTREQRKDKIKIAHEHCGLLDCRDCCCDPYCSGEKELDIDLEHDNLTTTVDYNETSYTDQNLPDIIACTQCNCNMYTDEKYCRICGTINKNYIHHDY